MKVMAAIFSRLPPRNLHHLTRCYHPLSQPRMPNRRARATALSREQAHTLLRTVTMRPDARVDEPLPTCSAPVVVRYDGMN